jgi:hypothetical protein
MFSFEPFADEAGQSRIVFHDQNSHELLLNSTGTETHSRLEGTMAQDNEAAPRDVRS